MEKEPILLQEGFGAGRGWQERVEWTGIKSGGFGVRLAPDCSLALTNYQPLHLCSVNGDQNNLIG